MVIRTFLALVLTVGSPALGSGLVLCSESDGRTAVEVAIGGRCADLVLAQRENAWATALTKDAPCSDSQLIESDSTAAKDPRVSDPLPLQVPLTAARFASPVLAEAAIVASLDEWPLLPRQHDQIASVVIQR